MSNIQLGSSVESSQYSYYGLQVTTTLGDEVFYTLIFKVVMVLGLSFLR